MKRFLAFLLCMVLAVMMLGCAGKNRQQMNMQVQQPISEQEILGRVPYPFSINLGPDKHYVINGKSDNINTSWLKFAAAMKPRPNEFSVWMDPKLVQQLQYNNNVQALFAEMGYVCKGQRLVDVHYVPDSQKGKRRAKKATVKMYQMDFVWGGGVPQTNMPNQQYRQVQPMGQQYQQMNPTGMQQPYSGRKPITSYGSNNLGYYSANSVNYNKQQQMGAYPNNMAMQQAKTSSFNWDRFWDVTLRTGTAVAGTAAILSR